MGVEQQTGRVRSGDVDLFYRVFGEPGRTPVLIFHGANYYDSADWIEVGTALAQDRQVIAWDVRGFGESDWSPSKDYSMDAQMADVSALLDHLGIAKVALMGHSMGGGHSILFASRFAARCAGLIVVDHCPGRGGGAARTAGGPTQAVDNPPVVFQTPDAALAVMARVKDVPAGSARHTRLEACLRPVEGGFVFRRDPDFSNPVPLSPPGWQPTIVADDMWAELAAIACPVLIVRGTESDRYTPEALARVRTEFPDIKLVDVPSGHDVAGAAPDALLAAALPFLAQSIDQA